MLLKGVNKRVIVIKNPESEIFEEAYFIIRSSNNKGVFKQSKENEMVMEANRIISDYHRQQRSIIEKNGIASSIGGDMSETENFMTKKNDTVTKINNIKNTGSTGKAGKNNKDGKLNDSKMTEINNPIAHLSDEEIFEDESFFDDMKNGRSFYKNSDFPLFESGEKEEKPFKSAFKFLSSKKIRFGNFRNIPVPPKSFFIGIGFMSAIIILIRIIELFVLR